MLLDFDTEKDVGGMIIPFRTFPPSLFDGKGKVCDLNTLSLNVSFQSCLFLVTSILKLDKVFCTYSNQPKNSLL